MKKDITKNKINILAGIVLFNPNIDRLVENINSVITQIDKLLLIDNNSENISDIEKIILDKKIEIIKNNQNFGIAKALNQILEYALDNNYSYFLSLDQDSILKENIIEKYKNYIKYKDVAIITSHYIDLNVELNTKFSKNKFEYVNFCITSGSLCNTEILNKLGGFDDYMFIDYVDYDICSTVIENNYKILKINEIGFYHEVGKSKKIKFLFFESIVYNHSYTRTYYIIRNMYYYSYKHRKSINTIKMKFRILKKKILILLFEKYKIKKLKMIIRAKKDFKSKKKELISNGR